MSRGIIYVMTTVVPGLVKIGKTGTSNFEQRMYNLERNGYFNVVGLRRAFAIEVDDYDEKESLLDEIFSKSRVPGSELFALDVDLVVQLLSSFEGRQVFPATESKEDAFDRATEELHVKEDWDLVPDGLYHMSRKVHGIGTVEADMEKRGGSFVLKAGSRCVPPKEGAWTPKVLGDARIEGGVLAEDLPCNAPSTAAWVVLGHSANGWTQWRDASGRPIDHYRHHRG